VSSGRRKAEVELNVTKLCWCVFGGRSRLLGHQEPTRP
jgi:hypothetical protein